MGIVSQRAKGHCVLRKTEAATESWSNSTTKTQHVEIGKTIVNPIAQPSAYITVTWAERNIVAPANTSPNVRHENTL